MAGLRSTGPAGERGMNGSNYTNYEYNNAHKPFEGGLVQPKWEKKGCIRNGCSSLVFI